MINTQRVLTKTHKHVPNVHILFYVHAVYEKGYKTVKNKIWVPWWLNQGALHFNAEVWQRL